MRISTRVSHSFAPARAACWIALAVGLGLLAAGCENPLRRGGDTQPTAQQAERERPLPIERAPAEASPGTPTEAGLRALVARVDREIKRLEAVRKQVDARQREVETLLDQQREVLYQLRETVARYAGAGPLEVGTGPLAERGRTGPGYGTGDRDGLSGFALPGSETGSPGAGSPYASSTAPPRPEPRTPARPSPGIQDTDTRSGSRPPRADIAPPPGGPTSPSTGSTFERSSTGVRELRPIPRVRAPAGLSAGSTDGTGAGASAPTEESAQSGQRLERIPERRVGRVLWVEGSGDEQEIILDIGRQHGVRKGDLVSLGGVGPGHGLWEVTELFDMNARAHKRPGTNAGTARRNALAYPVAPEDRDEP